ncbi:helix-turn-helix domain-containing protein [Paenibacillus arenosi]|uniref:Helix-turn-helix transcriptional regulator n=1 Tax=Paenibacillus arenosi TaxID=2774142 RepID=A0ABR9AUU1_9BACL|nr:AraC family transcriptional regulator [Paenibacillus arenosi]MBD8497002.1 helix-turn-helix transcriptional regulator [Paenibacillus arenosi]
MSSQIENEQHHESNQHVESEGHKAALRAIQYMKEHLDEEITSEQLAAHVGYSSYHFTRVFKRATGISPRHYLTALRMESGKKLLLKEPSLMMKVILKIGFRSAGSFHTRFKEHVGVSPKRFHRSARSLLAYMNQYKDQDVGIDQDLAIDSVLDKIQVPTQSPTCSELTAAITCHIDAPAAFRGIIFVGLFPRPIPDQRPIAGTALNRGRRTHTFTEVPAGRYYAMAVSIPWSLNPKDYFVLDHCLRGMYEEVIHVTDQSDQTIHIALRERQETDPPIIVNLPQLLFEQTASNRAK